MTDNEIIKALECCSVHPMKCKKCPYKEKECCTNAHRKDALDLINRLKVEDEKKTASIKGLNEKIEILNGVIANNKYVNDYYINKAKSEARKEFVAKAEEKAQNAQTWTGIEPVVTVSDLKNLLKEMG